MKNKKGFTLIELLAVIVILGIVVAIAIPGINSVITTARANTFLQEAKLIADGARIQLLGETFVAGSVVALPTSDKAVLIPIEHIAKDKGGSKSSYNSEWDTTKSYVIASLESNGGYKFEIAVQDAAGNRIDRKDVNLIERSDLKSTGDNKLASHADYNNFTKVTGVAN